MPNDKHMRHSRSRQTGATAAHTDILVDEGSEHDYTNQSVQKSLFDQMIKQSDENVKNAV